MAEPAGGAGPLIPRPAGPAVCGLVALMVGPVVTEVVTHGPALTVAPSGALAAVRLPARYRRGSIVELVRLERGHR